MMLNLAEGLSLNINDFVGRSVAVLGISGSGKSNTVAVLSEEFSACGLPMTIVDPEGEFFGLKQKYQILVVGKSENVDVAAGVADAAVLAQFSIDQSLSLILDLSEFSQQERDEFLSAYFERLWEVGFKLKRPYQIVLDEAHQVIPQMENTPLKNIITTIALRGRKRGLGIVSVSQRAAMVDKNILTQASILFLHRTVYPNDLKIYREIVPMEGKETNEAARNLQPGQAIVMANYEVGIHQIRQRHTYHGGSTPTFGDEQSGAQPEFQMVDTSLVETLRGMMNQVEEKSDAPGKWQSERATLIEQNKALLKRVDELTKQLEPATTQMQLPMDDSQLKVIPGNDYPVKASIERRLRNRQERKFMGLIAQIKNLTALDREILLFLGSHEGEKFDPLTMARNLGRLPNTVSKYPPKQLINLKLVMRSGDRGNFVYRSNLKEYLRDEFPLIGYEDLLNLVMDTLLKAERNRS